MFFKSKQKSFKTTKKQHRSLLIKELFNKRYLAFLIFIFCVCILVTIAAAYFKVTGSRTVSPLGKHIVFLLDLSDGFTNGQYDYFKNEFDYQNRLLQEGDWLSIYLIKEDPGRNGQGTGVQIFSRKRLPDGSNADITTHAPKILKNRFYQEFENPLNDALGRIKPERTAATSPILETLLTLARDREFVSTDSRRVMIFSNLMQNSESLNLFRENADFEELKKRSLWVLEVDKLFQNTDINVYLIPDDKNSVRQQDIITKFWTKYFSFSGGNLKMRLL